jgi:hypothetical protein
MADFENLQSLWKNQPPGNAGPALTDAFRRYGRRSDRTNAAKIAVLACLLLVLVTQLRHHPLAVFGACLAVFGGMFFLIHDWGTQRSIARLNFAEPSTAFLRSAIARLEAQSNPLHSSEFYIAIGAFCAGLTLMLVAAGPALSVSLRIFLHTLIVVLPFLVYRHGRVVRQQRFQVECQPLIERLTTVLRTIEGDHA